MAKEVKLEPGGGAFTVLGFLMAANYASVAFWEYPFLYCWTGPLFRQLYLDWGIVILYVSMLYTVYQLWRGSQTKALIGSLVFVAVINLPKVVDIVFRLGGSCG